MHKYLFLLLMIYSSLLMGQEETSERGLKYHSISFNFPPFSAYGADSSGGLQMAADLTLAYKKNLFTYMMAAGGEITVLGVSDNYAQINLMYGREFTLARTVFFEIHGGAGYFNFRSVDVDPNRSGQETAETIGLPLMGKLRFHTGPRFSIGLQMGANFNSAHTIWTAGIVLQWNKRKW